MNPNEEELKRPAEQQPLEQNAEGDQSGVGEYGLGSMMNMLNHNDEPIDENQGLYHFAEEQLDHKADPIDQGTEQ